MTTQRRPVVGCDIDDVIADFIGSFMTIAAARYGIDPAVRPPDWEWTGLGDTPERTKEIVDGVWKEIVNTENFWETLQIEPKVSRWQVNRLYRDTKMYFPTARAVCAGREVGEQSAYWLRKNFDIEFPTVFVSDQKGPLASALKYDYFLDDRPKNCVEVKTARPECKVFLKNASHNQGIVLPGIMRVSGFNEFANIVYVLKERND